MRNFDMNICWIRRAGSKASSSLPSANLYQLLIRPFHLAVPAIQMAHRIFGAAQSQFICSASACRTVSPHQACACLARPACGGWRLQRNMLPTDWVTQREVVAAFDSKRASPFVNPLQSLDAGSHLMPATPRILWLMWSLRMGTRVCTLASKLCRHMACSFFNAFSFR